MASLGQIRCLKGPRPNNTCQTQPACSRRWLQGERGAASWTTSKEVSSTTASVRSSTQVGVSLRRHPDGLERCQGLHINISKLDPLVRHFGTNICNGGVYSSWVYSSFLTCPQANDVLQVNSTLNSSSCSKKRAPECKSIT